MISTSTEEKAEEDKSGVVESNTNESIKEESGTGHNDNIISLVESMDIKQKDDEENKEVKQEKEDKNSQQLLGGIDISKGSPGALAFQQKLQHILKSQEEMLQMTFASKEKLHSTNEITLDQIKAFEQNSKKYAGYLKLIKTEFTTISEIMRKIKKLKK